MRRPITVLTAILTVFLTVVTTTAGPLDVAQTLTLELDAVPIPVVLGMIAEQHDLNIAISGEVTGEVTLRLQDVDVITALEAILAPNGYNYYLRGNVIVVKPMETTAIGELTSRVVTLKYLGSATTKQVLEPRLSSKGTISVLEDKTGGRRNGTFVPNRIMITDLPNVVEMLTELISDLDQPERMVSIEVKIIETKLDHKSKLGFAWPTDITTTLGAGTTNISEGTEAASGSETYETSLENTAGSYNLETGRWTWGTLTVDQLKTVLDLLNQRGNSKLLSDPHITTLENHEAEIKVQTIIPIPTINRFTEGAAVQDILTFQDEEVGISLKVIPRINEGGTITLDVFPQIEDIIGFSGPIGNQKPITSSRSIRTRITVQNGETIALGGLLKEDEIVQVQKVPLLGSIPLLGRLLFTNKSKEKVKTDLIILITPRISI